ncbi:hypothetical protein ALC60_14538 [Trachymyrmex zeteki]|uniref:Zinc finger protein 830 n=1 Tax=Mycetomoellerius zeteki TaxID=64791 RepID=A0A151WF45_9HYME|nr:hypothetical protein ALC60_14538 [Trachymyrmex zeteki]
MSLKRKLTQDDLRKAMSEHKKKFGTIKKIDSPLAKYPFYSGQLMCILCKSVVRSETIWPVHLNSKVHKDNVALAKKTKLETESTINVSNVQTFKRPPSPSNNSPNKKIKGILKNSSQPVVQVKSNLPADFFDDNSEQVNNPSVLTQKLESKEKDPIVNTTDVQHAKEEEKEKEKEKVKDMNQAVLPEGFFDDPVMDAKVRNVEYKDPIEEEWEKFQKEIKEETAQSAQIIADDQEEATTERQLDEIEEQIRHWSRVMDLAKRMEQVQGTDRKQENIDNDVSSGDEAEFDEFLDWRAKNSYK